jgi:ubiquinone/menaquinone biosynthesis C-methylase UbiE
MKIDEYEIMFKAEESHWWYHALHRLIASTVSSPTFSSPRAILDVGCGTGGFIFKHCRADSIVGLDYSPVALSLCKKRGLNKLLRGNIQSLPFPDGAFDIIICSSVLYHQWVDDVKEALNECYRVLKKRGLLILNVPSSACPLSDHDQKVCTARRFSKKELKTLLIKSQFGIKRLTSWTTLVFPMVWLLRRFNLMRGGRDFGSHRMPANGINAILKGVMSVEYFIQSWFQLPFGVSIFCIAQKN